METVSRLMQQRGDIFGNAGGIHEDEGLAARMQGIAIAARRLARARLEVEQSLRDHAAELTTEDPDQPR